MSYETAYRRSVQLAVANATAAGVSVRELLDGLLDQAGAVIVASTATKLELEAAVEVARNELDLKVVEYQRRSDGPNN